MEIQFLKEPIWGFFSKNKKKVILKLLMKNCKSETLSTPVFFKTSKIFEEQMRFLHYILNLLGNLTFVISVFVFLPQKLKLDSKES